VPRSRPRPLSGWLATITTTADKQPSNRRAIAASVDSIGVKCSAVSTGCYDKWNKYSILRRLDSRVILGCMADLICTLREELHCLKSGRKALHMELCFQARRILANAIRQGKVTRLPCEVCQSKQTVGHHSNYAKPLQVHWLCHAHHQAIHRVTDRAPRTLP